MKVATAFKESAYAVDTRNIIPVWVVSNKQEFTDHTMHDKVFLRLEKYIVEPPISTYIYLTPRRH